MSAPLTEEAEATRIFVLMDAKAREIVEKRFGARLDSSRSGEKQQAAWDVYQNATVKILKALQSASRIDDPSGYAATIARNSCHDYWRLRNPGWADLKGHLTRFASSPHGRFGRPTNNSAGSADPRVGKQSRSPPAREATTWADRMRVFFRTPQLAIIAMVALVAVVLSPVVLREAGHPRWSAFAGPSRPESLKDLPANPDATLLYPVSEAIEEQQAIFEWRPVDNAPAQIFLFDAAHREIAHSDLISGVQWLAPVPLDRGAVYSWEVRTAAGTRMASFRVLSEADHQNLAAARASNTPPAQVGKMARTMGALSEAQRQFRQEIRRDPGDSAARQELDEVIRMRGR